MSIETFIDDPMTTISKEETLPVILKRILQKILKIYPTYCDLYLET